MEEMARADLEKPDAYQEQLQLAVDGSSEPTQAGQPEEKKTDIEPWTEEDYANKTWQGSD